MTESSVMRFIQLSILCVLLVALTDQCPLVSAADVGQSSSKIAGAETAVQDAFKAVFDASLVGANVSVLVGRLNMAINLLVSSKNAFSVGDFDNASLLADQCNASVTGVASDAEILRDTFASDKSNNFVLSFELASIGLSVLLAVSLFVWRLVKKRYFASVYDLKPEEVST